MAVDLFHPAPDIEVRPSKGEDAVYLGSRLRAEDLAEIVASTGEKPVLALSRGFLASKPCWTVLYKGEPSAMFGVVPSQQVGDVARVGRVWFLGSDRVRLWGKSFCRFTAAWLVKMGQDFEVLGCVVDQRQIAHIKWLRSVGFKHIRVHDKYGKLGLPFDEMAVATCDIKGE